LEAALEKTHAPVLDVLCGELVDEVVAEARHDELLDATFVANARRVAEVELLRILFMRSLHDLVEPHSRERADLLRQSVHQLLLVERVGPTEYPLPDAGAGAVKDRPVVDARDLGA